MFHVLTIDMQCCLVLMQCSFNVCVQKKKKQIRKFILSHRPSLQAIMKCQTLLLHSKNSFASRKTGKKLGTCYLKIEYGNFRKYLASSQLNSEDFINEEIDLYENPNNRCICKYKVKSRFESRCPTGTDR